MLDLILLPEEFGREKPEVVSPPGEPPPAGIPSPNGHCTKAECGYQVFRFLDERNGRALTPTCLVCSTAYPGTPPNIDLPLLIVNRRNEGGLP